MDLPTAFIILTAASSLFGAITIGVIIANLLINKWRARKTKKEKEVQDLIKTLENF